MICFRDIFKINLLFAQLCLGAFFEMEKNRILIVNFLFGLFFLFSVAATDAEVRKAEKIQTKMVNNSFV